jgi:hypothetical protein
MTSDLSASGNWWQNRERGSRFNTGQGLKAAKLSSSRAISFLTSRQFVDHLEAKLTEHGVSPTSRIGGV